MVHALFYKLIVLQCVLALPVHNHIMIKIHPMFFFYSPVSNGAT